MNEAVLLSYLPEDLNFNVTKPSRLQELSPSVTTAIAATPAAINFPTTTQLQFIHTVVHVSVHRPSTPKEQVKSQFCRLPLKKYILI